MLPVDQLFLFALAALIMLLSPGPNMASPMGLALGGLAIRLAAEQRNA